MALPSFPRSPDPAETNPGGPDLEELRRRLIEAGYPPQDVDAWLSAAPGPGQTAADAAQAAGAPEEVVQAIGAGESFAIAGPEHNVPTFTQERAMAKVQSGGQLSPEEASAVAEDPTLLQDVPEDSVDALLQAAAAIAGVNEWNYDWVYNDLQVQPGVLDTEQALIQLWGNLGDLGLVSGEEELTDAEKASRVKEILARNSGNVAVRMAVNEWAGENGYRVPDQRIDGVPISTIAALSELGLPQSRAITVSQIANSFEVDPFALAEVWESQEEKTYFGGSVMGLERDLQTGADISGRFTRRPLLETAAAYKAGLALYGESKVLAAVHVNDPDLARRLASDPYGLDSGELRRVLDYVGGAEGKEADPQVSWIMNRLAGAYEVTAQVDSEQVRNAVQTLADAWNLTGTDQVAAAIAGEMVAEAVAQARATLPNPFRTEVGSPVSVQDTIQDITAQVKSRFRQLPEYQQLFSQKRPGESEEEYVRRFESESQRILGDDNAAVVRTGMRTGNINSIYQQALHTEAGDASTRFQQILAQNAEIFREFL